jgi:uncharacterized membrane protein YgcG
MRWFGWFRRKPVAEHVPYAWMPDPVEQARAQQMAAESGYKYDKDSRTIRPKAPAPQKMTPKPQPKKSDDEGSLGSAILGAAVGYAVSSSSSSRSSSSSDSDSSSSWGSSSSDSGFSGGGGDSGGGGSSDSF